MRNCLRINLNGLKQFIRICLYLYVYFLLKNTNIKTCLGNDCDGKCHEHPSQELTSEFNFKFCYLYYVAIC